MKYYLTLILLILLSEVNVIAQNYYPGYAIKTNGDTLKGFIKYKRWEYNPKSIQFKPDVNDKARTLSLNDTKYFSIDIGYPLDFQKYEGQISTNDIEIDRATTFRDTGFRMDTVYLKAEPKTGKVTAFSYDDKIKTRFFIADGNAAPVELLYRMYIKSDEQAGRRVVNEDIYKTQLTAIAEKYGKLDDKLKADIALANYSEANIVSIVNKINGYNGPDVTKGNNLAGAPKVKLLLMGVVVILVLFVLTSVVHFKH